MDRAVDEARGVRQRRADERRRRVFAAARELFATRGYHETTVERIAALAGVSKGAFFLYFPSKDAVVRELVGIQVRAARRARAAALTEGRGPLAALRAAVLMLGEQAGASRTLSRAVLAATLEKEEIGRATSALFDALFLEMREDARAAGSAGMLAPGARADELARSLMTCYLGAALHFTTWVSSEPLAMMLAPLVDVTLASAAKAPPRASPSNTRVASRSRSSDPRSTAPRPTTRRRTNRAKT